MSDVSSEQKRVSETIVFACCGGDEGAAKALHARLEGLPLRDAAEEGGISVNRLVRVEELYQAAVERLGKRVRAGSGGGGAGAVGTST